MLYFQCKILQILEKRIFIMNSKKTKLLCAVLSMSLIASLIAPTTAKAVENSAPMQTDMVKCHTDERSNLTFVEGMPGESHLVYTYDQNDRKFSAYFCYFSNWK